MKTYKFDGQLIVWNLLSLGPVTVQAAQHEFESTDFYILFLIVVLPSSPPHPLVAASCLSLHSIVLHKNHRQNQNHSDKQQAHQIFSIPI